LQEEIEDTTSKAADSTPEEQEKEFEKVLRHWEDSWMIDGLVRYDHDDADDYYSSPEYELEITESYLQSLNDIELLFDFRYVLRSSFFVHLCSFVEVRLNRVCDWVAYLKKTPIRVGDLRYSGVRRARTYLLQVAGINLAKVAGWSDLMDYNKLRNYVVHNRGVPKRDSHLDRYIRRSGVPLQRGKQGQVIFGREFCEDVLETVETFFQELDLELRAGVS
jgi:hypothetical protein